MQDSSKISTQIRDRTEARAESLHKEDLIRARRLSFGNLKTLSGFHLWKTHEECLEWYAI